MAYLVLVAGAVMVLIGAMAIVTGYPIIQVERGWATVIAGTSLLASGVVTMALALVLRALVNMRFALATPEAAHAAPGPQIGHADRSLEPAFTSPGEVNPPDSSRRDTMMLGAAAVAIPVTALALHAASEPHEAERHPAEDAAHDHEAQTHDLPVHDAHPGTIDPTPSQEQAPADHAHEPAAPALDDWLDRAFADLHEPAPPAHADPVPAAKTLTPDPSYAAVMSTTDLIVEHAPATQPHDDHLEAHAAEDFAHENFAQEARAREIHDREPQEAHAEAAHAEPAAQVASQPTSAVIGRYEADGTAYTMYADGSIDAQSDAGVYRFASMAELKAFIEG